MRQLLEMLTVTLALAGCPMDSDDVVEDGAGNDAAANDGGEDRSHAPAPTGDTGMETGEVSVLPWFEGPAPMSFIRDWQAPAWMAVSDLAGWSEVSAFGDRPTPIPVATDPSGRFAVAQACPADGVVEVTVFLGHADDGDALQLPGCAAAISRDHADSTLTIDPSFYANQDAGNNTCGIISYGNSVWIASCNPVTSIRLSPLVGGPTQLYGQRYDAQERTDRVVLEGPIDIPTGGRDITVDFDGPNSADPVYATVTSALEAVTATMVAPWARLSVRRTNKDVGIPLIPSSIAPAGARWIVQANRFPDPEVFLADTEMLVLDAPPTKVTMGEAFQPTRPELTIDASTSTATLTAEPDWAVLTLGIFPSDGTPVRWRISASRSFLGEQDTITIPAGTELDGLLDWASSVVPSIDDKALGLPAEAIWSLSVWHVRDATVAPFDVWRSQYAIDALPAGVRIVSEQALGNFP